MSVYQGELEDVAASVGRAAAPVFEAQGWEWRDVGVPDAAQIAACVTHLLEGVRGKDGSSHCSGRFCATYYIDGGYEAYEVTLELGSLLKEVAA